MMISKLIQFQKVYFIRIIIITNKSEHLTPQKTRSLLDTNPGIVSPVPSKSEAMFKRPTRGISTNQNPEKSRVDTPIPSHYGSIYHDIEDSRVRKIRSLLDKDSSYKADMKSQKYEGNDTSPTYSSRKRSLEEILSPEEFFSNLSRKKTKSSHEESRVDESSSSSKYVWK